MLRYFHRGLKRERQGAREWRASDEHQQERLERARTHTSLAVRLPVSLTHHHHHSGKVFVCARVNISLSVFAIFLLFVGHVVLLLSWTTRVVGESPTINVM